VSPRPSANAWPIVSPGRSSGTHRNIVRGRPGSLPRTRRLLSARRRRDRADPIYPPFLHAVRDLERRRSRIDSSPRWERSPSISTRSSGRSIGDASPALLQSAQSLGPCREPSGARAPCGARARPRSRRRIRRDPRRSRLRRGPPYSVREPRARDRAPDGDTLLGKQGLQHPGTPVCGGAFRKRRAPAALQRGRIEALSRGARPLRTRRERRGLALRPALARRGRSLPPVEPRFRAELPGRADPRDPFLPASATYLAGRLQRAALPTTPPHFLQHARPRAACSGGLRRPSDSTSPPPGDRQILECMARRPTGRTQDRRTAHAAPTCA
jgi:hypothetical protein